MIEKNIHPLSYRMKVEAKFVPMYSFLQQLDQILSRLQGGREAPTFGGESSDFQDWGGDHRNLIRGRMKIVKR